MNNTKGCQQYSDTHRMDILGYGTIGNTVSDVIWDQHNTDVTEHGHVSRNGSVHVCPETTSGAGEEYVY